MNPTDLIEQFADGEAVAPDALVAALATAEGREHLRGVLALRALMAEAPVRATPLVIRASSSSSTGAHLSFARIAAAALLATAAAAVGYTAGTRQTSTPAPIAGAAGTSVERINDAPPPPTTVIRLDATHGWRDQSGGF